MKVIKITLLSFAWHVMLYCPVQKGTLTSQAAQTVQESLGDEDVVKAAPIKQGTGGARNISPEARALHIESLLNQVKKDIAEIRKNIEEYRRDYPLSPKVSQWRSKLKEFTK